MRHRFVVTVAIAAAIAAILAVAQFVEFWQDRLPSEISSSSCSDVHVAWMGRDGKGAIALMKEGALEFELSENWAAAICTLELALDKASATNDRALQSSIARQLASVYLENKMYNEAEQTLTESLKLTDGNDTVAKLRRAQALLQLAEIADKTGAIATQRKYLEMARAEQTDEDSGALFRERLYLAEIDFFESQGEYDKAIDSAACLLKSRLEWVSSMPENVDEGRVRAARIEYVRLLRLGGYVDVAETVVEEFEACRNTACVSTNIPCYSEKTSGRPQ
jgi:tetratricopeptide (TPR) repeat protein